MSSTDLSREVRYRASKAHRRALMWTAYKMPRSLVYWCGIRMWAYGTDSPYQNQPVNDLTVETALKRWEA